MLNKVTENMLPCVILHFLAFFNRQGLSNANLFDKKFIMN